MFPKDIEALLQKNLESLPVMVGDRSLRHDIDELVAMVLPPSRIAVVDDVYTSDALGNTVARALKGRFAVTHITLDKDTTASSDAADDIRRRADGCEAYIAVGSGTINDLCKYVSHTQNKPYLVFPTAASMNGYVSANASISEDGFKHTLPAHMPRAVFCDYTVLAEAPARLSQSGLGDSIARPTAQADWLLSHLLLGTAYNPVPFELLANIETHVFENARGIAAGDKESIQLLTQLLLLSGFGMVIAGGSYPASQGEHMIAHSYDMATSRRRRSLPALHGEEIAVTSLFMAGLQQRMLAASPALRPLSFPNEAMAEHLGTDAASEAKKAYYKKCEQMEAAALNTDTLKSKWDETASKISGIMLAPSRMEAVLSAAGAPTSAKQLGWDDGIYRFAQEHARYTRDRFTFLDIS